MISIIGAGPAGNYLAALLAKHGKEVCVYEEHNKIGEPVQCAGGVTSRIKELISIKKQFLINKIKTVRLYSPDKNYVDINLREPNYIFDRAKFDKYLAEKAIENGAKYNTGWKFLGFENGLLKFNKGYKKTDILVGADGPMSKVAKVFGFGNRKCVVCFQARMSGDFDGDMIEGYMHEDYYGAVIPESNKIARVAIIANRNLNYNFKEFLKKFNGKIKEYNTGLVPVYDPKLKTQRGNVYLVGDAAGQVKASTFGGIVSGMMAARELARAIIEKCDYERLWRKKIGKEMRRHLSVRKRLIRFNNKDLNELVKLVKQDKIRTLLEEYDRDNLNKYAMKLILREPRFLKFLF